MNAQYTTNSGFRFYINMTRQSDSIRNNHFIFDDAIVSDMGISKEQIIITD